MAEEELVGVVIGAIAAALFFDFVNGFHDSANAIATVVGTRVLKPLYAVSMAAVANLLARLYLEPLLLQQSVKESST